MYRFHDSALAELAAVADAVGAQMTYNQGIVRPSDPAPLVPQPVSTQIIEELPQQCGLLTRARSVPMSSRTDRMPVLSVLPTAYWVTGDQGLKQTTEQDWKNVTLTAEELAVIVPIPQAYLDDADVPIWDEVRPRVVEAFGAAIDAAGLFGVNAPTSWQDSHGNAGVYNVAVAAGNTVTSSGDLGTDIASMGVELGKGGYAINGFLTAPGFVWNLVGYRNAQGFPIYQPDPRADISGAGTLYGYGLKEVWNGAFDPTKASLIGGDWSKVILGLRQDITFQMFTEGVITDNTGKVILNLMQQDSIALRAVMRVGFAMANPITRLNASKSDINRAAFSVLNPVSALS